jgi:hypothetical protein
LRKLFLYSALVAGGAGLAPKSTLASSPGRLSIRWLRAGDKMALDGQESEAQNGIA